MEDLHRTGLGHAVTVWEPSGGVKNRGWIATTRGSLSKIKELQDEEDDQSYSLLWQVRRLHTFYCI